MSRLSVRALAVSGSLLLAVVLSGCDLDNYPADLVYPVRTDPIYPDGLIKKLNSDYVPQRIDRPGEFPDLITKLPPDAIKERINPADLPGDVQGHLQKTLTDLFGTPFQPKAEGVDVAALKLEPDRLAAGSQYYRQQCLHCHGLTGNGQGPTAPWVNPHPRDYRPGRFKFTSSSQDEGNRKPRREDLLRTLREGIEGTSMPAFRLLPDNELEALTSYVIHLSMRGEVEMNVFKDYVNKEVTGEAGAIANQAKEWLTSIAGNWLAAEKSAIRPGAYPKMDEEARLESARRGKDLFMSRDEAGCIGCHQDFGRKYTYSYDVWGTINRPADLTLTVYRGGRRPLDLYYRIHSGINGSGMTAFGKALDEKQIWDLVNFVQFLPYSKMREQLKLEID